MRRKTTSKSTTTRPAPAAPPAEPVEVKPDVLRLKRGDQSTFTSMTVERDTRGREWCVWWAHSTEGFYGLAMNLTGRPVIGQCQRLHDGSIRLLREL